MRNSDRSLPPDAGRAEASTTWGPNPESWFPWHPDKGVPALYYTDIVRVQLTNGDFSNEFEVGAFCWSGPYMQVAKIGVMHRRPDVLARMEALTGYRAPRIRPSLSPAIVSEPA